MTTQEIRTLRRALNLNTRDFGALVGVTGRAVENWEQGRAKPLTGSALLLRRLAEDHKNSMPQR